MNKSLWIGIGIFFTIIIGLFSFSLTTDVNAQIILTGDSTANVSYLMYQLNISELNLSDSITLIDNITNITSFVYLTNNITYDCRINASDGIYLDEVGTTTNITDWITVNQTLINALTEGYYSFILGCDYDVVTFGYNESTNYTHNVNRTFNKFTEKTILVDTMPPIILLVNQSTLILYNNTLLLNFTITDVSTMNCAINILSNNVTGNLTNLTTTFISNTSNVSILLNLAEGNYSYTITCTDVLNNTNTAYSLIQIVQNTTNITSEVPFFDISLSAPVFALGELGHYIISANNGSNVSITICPVGSGWVQCFMVPTFVNYTYPQTQGLPYTNKTGSYIIEGVMRYKNYTLIRNVTYNTTNTLVATITASKSKGVVNDIITFNATATSGIAPYTYKWTMHDNTKFTSAGLYGGAYKTYTAAGTFRVNLTVNDSVGNMYTTYLDVLIRDSYKLTVIVYDTKTNARINDAIVKVDTYTANTDASGVATFQLIDGNYNLRASKYNYIGYNGEVNLNQDKTVYMNMSFSDSTPPVITLLTANDVVLDQSAVDLKFKAEDTSNVACSLYIAEANTSWYTLKDSGDNLLTNTEYTFELRDLNNNAYKWKIECIDNDNNKAYSNERTFVVSDGSITVALASFNQNSDSINAALDNLNQISGEESDVAEILSIKTDLQDLLDRINRLDRDVHDLSYRRDLDEKGIQDAQKSLTLTIDYLKDTTPVNLKVTDSKTFVKYVHDDDLKSLIDEYSVIKSLKLDRRLFLESTKRVQSKVIISTRVRNVELYYLNGEVREITLITKDIQAAKPEDDLLIANSNSMTFVEVIPKTIIQSAKGINMISKDYTIIKDDPLIEYPADTRSIIYYINGTIKTDEFQDTDTVLMEKNINTMASSTGLSILGMNSISDIQFTGQGMMIIIIVILILFYIIVNFDIIDKIRNIGFGSTSGFLQFGSKKKVSYIKVLINDALDYLKMEDYDKAALIYREVKLSYEEASDYVKQQVYDESFELCNQLDLDYALKMLDKAEYYAQLRDRNNALIASERLENTYNKLSDKYQRQIDDRFHKIMLLIKGN